MNHKRVERIWRREGLKVPQKQPPRRRLWLTDGARVRLRPKHPNHVWACDFVALRTEDGRPVKLLTIMDEYTREWLAIDVLAGCGPMMCCSVLPTSLCSAGCLNIFDRTMALNVPPRPCATGSTGSACACCSLSRGARGRMAMWRVSTGSYATNC